MEFLAGFFAVAAPVPKAHPKLGFHKGRDGAPGFFHGVTGEKPTQVDEDAE